MGSEMCIRDSSYFNHWGTHGGAALRALHAVVAHASLDVAEEQMSP